MCLNTLGQDRAFSQDEINFALKAVKHYRDTWEQLDQNNLRHDLEQQIKYQDYDKDYKERLQQMDEAKLDDMVE